MAEDDNFDLDDDDLDLGDESDDSDDGDDFAGELDEMMGDDDLGDDGGDGELDSFFEDLSSIEDVEDGDDEPEAPAPEEKPKQSAPAAPAAATPVKEKSGGAFKWIIIIIGTILLLGGGSFWLFFTGEEPPIVEETVPSDSLFIDEPVIEVEQPKAPVKPVIQVEPIRPIAPPPVVRKPVVSKYLIQIATCSFNKCKNDHTRLIRSQGEPVFYKKAKENYDFIELITKEVFSYRKAKYLVDKINRKNKLAGTASIKDQSNGFRVTMGTFTALDRAKEVKFYIEKRLPQSNLRFVMEHVQQDYQTTKVFAGPFDNRTEAKKVLAEFKRKKVFPGAFLVRY